MPEVSRADVLAMGDVLDLIAEESDTMSLERAVGLKDALGAMKAKLEATIGLLRTTAIRVLDDSPAKSAIVGGRVLTAKPTGKWRPDQGKIRQRVVGLSAYNADGEEVAAVDAAANAVNLMYDLFVAPKDWPKKSGLDKLHLTKEDVGEFERTGTELKETPL